MFHEKVFFLNFFRELFSRKFRPVLIIRTNIASAHKIAVYNQFFIYFFSAASSNFHGNSKISEPLFNSNFAKLPSIGQLIS